MIESLDSVGVDALALGVFDSKIRWVAALEYGDEKKQNTVP